MPTRSPAVLSTAAVLHAIATAVMYRPNVAIPTDTVIQRAKTLMATAQHPGPFSNDRDFRGFRAMLDAEQMSANDVLVRDALDAAATAGHVDVMRSLVGEGEALTPAGVDRAFEIRPLFDRRTLTTEWLDQHITKDEYTRLVRHIANRARHSRDESEIREFVHDYVANIGGRDGLRARLVSGDIPAPSTIRAWVWKQTLTTFRNEGTDALTRTVKNARTERDLRGATPMDAFSAPVDGTSTAVYAIEGDEGVGSFATSAASPSSALLDVMDVSPSPEDILAHKEHLARGMARLDAAVRSYKPGAAVRYSRVLSHLAAGLSPNEIAEAENVSRNRGATLLAEVRTAGKQMVTMDRTRGAIVEYLVSEPMSTVSDLTSDLAHAPEDIQAAINELLSEGHLTVSRGSFRVTDLGRNSIDA